MATKLWISFHLITINLCIVVMLVFLRKSLFDMAMLVFLRKSLFDMASNKSLLKFAVEFLHVQGLN